MRRLFLIAILILATLPASAARRVTVAQLEQTLSASLARHRSDADTAHQLANLELTERLTAPTLDRLNSTIPALPQTAIALQLLADQSSLLDPPREEMPAAPAPDLPTQQRILAAARSYVVHTLPLLPNFFATRNTLRFDDSAQVIHPGDWPVRAGFHPVGQSSSSVTVRDGREVIDAPQQVAEHSEQSKGLYSFGEFGPVLTRTLTDLAGGKIEFSHWEASPLGVVAVYNYSVPQRESHYLVHFCCIINQQFLGATSYRTRGRPAYPTGDPKTIETAGRAYDVTPAYSGTLAIEPTTGAIARMTLDARLDPDSPITRASTVVEYGKVLIGDREFVCPIRSLAITAQQGPPSPNGNPERVPIVSINETTFTQYHRLGSSARVIADPVLQAAATDAAAAPQWIAGASAQPAPESPTQPAPTAAASTVPAPAAAAPPPAPEAASDAPQPEMIPAETSAVPDLPANTQRPQSTGFSLKMTTRLVDVTVLALDKKGRPVTDLKPEDFELYDDGRKQNIRFFTAAEAAAQLPSAPADAPASVFSNRATEPTSSPLQAINPAGGGTILLIDESHIAWSDLNYARGQMLQFLSKLPPGERAGLYSMTGLGFRVLAELTSDHAAVVERLRNFLPTAQSISQAHEEERRNRQQFETVHNLADLNSVNGNHNDVPDSVQPVDPELLTLGSNPARASLIILAQVARHLAAIPGHKSLVWVSTDNVLADWQDQSVGIDKSPSSNRLYALRVQEAMNDAHTAVYPFDISQLEGGAINADLQHSSVQLDPAVTENAASADAGGTGIAPSTRDTGTGRISAAMSQDLHPIQGIVRDVATGTGGRTIRRTAELAAALSGIAADGRSTCQLSFSPSTPADDRYHSIVVKLTGRRGITLRYRTGYLYAREPDTPQERFKQAIWQPTDVSEIAITAKLDPAGPQTSVNLSIAARDLALEQQAGRWMDKLDIFFIQRDDAGIHAQAQGEALGLRLKPETYQNALTSGIPFAKSFALKPGTASLRVIVVDQNSGRMGSVTIPASALQPPR